MADVLRLAQLASLLAVDPDIVGRACRPHVQVDVLALPVRGHVDIAINGTYWGGAALGAAANLLFLNQHIFSQNIGWRLAFFIGAVLGVIIIFLRRHIPESPRWLMPHGREKDAEDTVTDIENRVKANGYELEEVSDSDAIEVSATGRDAEANQGHFNSPA